MVTESRERQPVRNMRLWPNCATPLTMFDVEHRQSIVPLQGTCLIGASNPGLRCATPWALLGPPLCGFGRSAAALAAAFGLATRRRLAARLCGTAALVLWTAALLRALQAQRAGPNKAQGKATRRAATLPWV